MKSNFCVLINNDLIVLHLLGVFISIFYFFGEEKSQLPGFELTSQRVRRLRGYQMSYREKKDRKITKKAKEKRKNIRGC